MDHPPPIPQTLDKKLRNIKAKQTTSILYFSMSSLYSSVFNSSYTNYYLSFDSSENSLVFFFLTFDYFFPMIVL